MKPYHPHFKDLPPLRDGKVINLKAMCTVINEVTDKNTATLISDGITLNGVDVHIGYGLVTAKSSKWRYRFLGELLHNLVKEHLLYGTDEEIDDMELAYKTITN